MLAEIETLEKAMRDLLAMLADPKPEGLATAWQRCGAAQAELNALLADTSRLEPTQREELRDGLEELVRLNAITRQAVKHNQDTLSRSLMKTKRESVTVRAYGAGTADIGGSCDLAG